MWGIDKKTVCRLAGGALVLISWQISPCDNQCKAAYADSSNSSTPPAQPPKTAQKVGDKYEGFYFRVWDSLGKQELAERVVVRAMADGSEKIVELNVDASRYVQMQSYSEGETDTRPPTYKPFDLEIAVDYLPKNSDGTPGEQVHLTNTQRIDVPYGADFMVVLKDDGSVSLGPLPSK
jgi:hypothetical protein